MEAFAKAFYDTGIGRLRFRFEKPMKDGVRGKIMSGDDVLARFEIEEGRIRRVQYEYGRVDRFDDDGRLESVRTQTPRMKLQRKGETWRVSASLAYDEREVGPSLDLERSLAPALGQLSPNMDSVLALLNDVADSDLDWENERVEFCLMNGTVVQVIVGKGKKAEVSEFSQN